MQVSRRRGLRGLLSGTVLGFVVMLLLLGLATYLLFTVRSELDLARLDDNEAAAQIADLTTARTSAETNVTQLQQSQTSLQQQVEAALIAKGVAEETARRETATRMAAEAESAQQESAKTAALQEIERQRQLKEAAEASLEQEKQATEEAQRRASSERLARDNLQRQLNSARLQTRTDLAREQAAGHPLLVGIVNGALTYETEPLPDYAAEGVADALDEALGEFDQWNAQGFTVSRAEPEADADLTIGWIRDYGDHPHTSVGAGSRVMVALGATDCAGDWRPFDGETVRRLLWHEIGHALGYGDSDDADNIMSSDLQTRFAVGQTVDLVVAPGPPHVIPLCGAGTFTYVFDEPAQGQQGYQIALVKPGVAPEDYYDEENQYMGCSSTADLYTNQCSAVEEGSVLLVYTQVAIARISGTITKDVELPDIDMVWDPDTLVYTQAELQTFKDLFS